MISSHSGKQFQNPIDMNNFRFIVWNIIRMPSFLCKEICHDSEIAMKAVDFLVRKPCDFEYVDPTVVDIIFQTIRNLHQ